MNEPAQLESSIVEQYTPKPKTPPPLTQWVVFAFYEGPGWMNNSWALKGSFNSPQQARSYCDEKLNKWYTHKVIALVQTADAAKTLPVPSVSYTPCYPNSINAIAP